MDFFHSAQNYIRHIIQAGDEHSIHSPFVFNFYSKIIRPEKKYYCFDAIEETRNNLYTNQGSINIRDLGAGSSTKSSRKISEIAKRAEKPLNLGQLLFRITNFYKPTYIVDLGTSLGITTLYFANAAPKSQVFTFEGCPETLSIARQNFERLNTSNINPVEGNIDDTLKATLRTLDRLDLVFFDANHRYQPTLNYFYLCLEKAHDNSIFIFDDIYWSKEMTRAWKEIINDPAVMISVDLFHLGLVIFRKNQPKQHFKLKI